jgi:hypothetical protein
LKRVHAVGVAFLVLAGYSSHECRSGMEGGKLVGEIRAGSRNIRCKEISILVLLLVGELWQHLVEGICENGRSIEHEGFSYFH